MNRIRDVPVYAQRDDEVTAKLYNLWRRAKLHHPCPMRISLPSYPGMVILLEEREWICANERQGDLPVLAWMAFEDQGRDALHEPVKCKLNYYHVAASKLRGAALRLMEEKLEHSLHDDEKLE